MRFGVDEAGKGPVLGSMFAAAVRADPVALPDGVGDSKDIKPERRERLAGEIRESADAVGLAEIPVDRIDADGTDMNTLTVDAQATALSAVARDGLSGTVDAGDTDAERFGRRVADAVDTDLTVTAEHGADETNPLVGAASIIAKVARDAHVRELADEYGDVGSGYPSDPTTRAFLADYVDHHGELPACARRSWSTCDDVLAAASQATLGDF
ncbi:ribonuclease HII [Haloarcula sp. CBA1130]|uniref:ribonuclease HII n=1 Tax=unclassified Haloarcula TaxID=2624677 RepID=UPI00124532D8|nr:MULTISPECIES: ribonuclease HII [unclassified Haloarcula]KAA9399015.1 ribonuclease HII [Haloarcula sp. CBA1129]KAA9403530.1 ribonuclease HII [Haloarcula sp. CBA1130]